MQHHRGSGRKFQIQKVQAAEKLELAAPQRLRKIPGLQKGPQAGSRAFPQPDPLARRKGGLQVGRRGRPHTEEQRGLGQGGPGQGRYLQGDAACLETLRQGVRAQGFQVAVEEGSHVKNFFRGPEEPPIADPKDGGKRLQIFSLSSVRYDVFERF